MLSLPPPESDGLGDGGVAFLLGELTAAGTYTAVAEYVEGRPAVLAGVAAAGGARRAGPGITECGVAAGAALRLDHTAAL